MGFSKVSILALEAIQPHMEWEEGSLLGAVVASA